MTGLPPNFFDLCRTCKKLTSKERKTLFNEEISTFFVNYPSLASSDPDNEKLPRVVCKSCFEIMDFVNKFVWRAERVKREFEQIAVEEPQTETCKTSDDKGPQKVAEQPHSDKENDLQNQDDYTPPTKTIKISSSLDNLAASTLVKKYFICSSCRIIFQSVEEATIHEMNHKSIKHTCQVCNARFNTSSGLKKHIQGGQHSTEKHIWTCSLCSFCHVSWAAVKLHLSTEHKPCEECNTFWKKSLNKAKEGYSFVHTKFCTSCGKLVKFMHEKEDLPLKLATSTQSYDDNGILEEGISDLCEVKRSDDGFLSPKEIKKEAVDESEVLSVSKAACKLNRVAVTNNNPVPTVEPVVTSLKEVPLLPLKKAVICLQKLTSENIQRALGVQSKAPLCQAGDQFDNSSVPLPDDDNLATDKSKDLDSEFVNSSSSGKPENCVSESKKVQEDIVPPVAKKVSPSSLILKCKYCTKEFIKQLEYVVHIRKDHM